MVGVVLVNLEFWYELESDLELFKGLFFGLFFIMVGVGFDFDVFFGDLFCIVVLMFLLIVVKVGILYGLVCIWCLKLCDCWFFLFSFG